MKTRPLEGLTIAITADRRADEQAEMLARRGAQILHAPTIKTMGLGPDERIRRVTEELITHPPDVLIANTGIGLRWWFGMAETIGLGDALLAALAGAHRLSRGPKASGALTAAGLKADWQAPSERLQEVVDRAIAGGVAGRRVAVQLDGGDDDGAAATCLRAAGADAVEVPVYRWTLPDDVGPVARLIDAACAGRVDAVTFTSGPAVKNLFVVADQRGQSVQLREALNGRVLAMCVGPVCLEAAEECGVTGAQPRRARLGSMVQAVTERLQEWRVTFALDGREVIRHGALVASGDEQVLLPERERVLFEALTRRPGAVVSKAALLAAVWGPEAEDTHVLEVTVGRLRRRLQPTRLTVDAIPRRGYRLGLLAG